MVSLFHGKNQIFRYAGTLIVLFAGWQAASSLTGLPFIPAPALVLENTSNIFIPHILLHLRYSLWRIFAGILLSVLLGIPLGFCMGYWHFADRYLSPLLYFLYPVPKIAFLPLVMLVFGLGDFSKVFMIMLIVLFQVMVSSRDAVKGIPGETYNSLRAFGAGNPEIFRYIIIPAALPGLLTGLRLCLGTALSVLFFTETFGTSRGMGYFIMDAWMRVNYIEMYSGILILGITGFFLFTTVDLMERKFCKWKH